MYSTILHSTYKTVVSCTYCAIWQRNGDDLGRLELGRLALGRKLSSALTKFSSSEGGDFQQDNASRHTVRSIKVEMKDHQIKTLT